LRLPSSFMISISGIRGLIGDGMNPETAARFTAAYADSLKGGTVVVGRDTRSSGEALQAAVTSALTFLGFDCVVLGIAATPTVEIMVGELKAAGGIIITASHNGPEWNALKFLDAKGEFIDAASIERIKTLAAGDGNLFKAPGRWGKVSLNGEGDRIHIRRIINLPNIDPGRIGKRGLKAVVDCVNGAGSRIVPSLLRELGVKVVELYTDTEEPFPHTPEPRPENLADLSGAVRREGADIGFACDPDADRLVLVDETGRVCSEELTLALAADYVLGLEKGPVAANLSTTRLIDDIASRYGVPLHRSSVGEANVISVMKREGAVIGGEGNGGVIYPPVHYGRDAMTGMALVLQSLAEEECSLSERVGSLGEYHIIKVKHQYSGRFENLAESAEKSFKGEKNTTDGIRIDMEDGWIHIRMSNTEPVVRLIAEAATREQAEAILRTAESLLEPPQ